VLDAVGEGRRRVLRLADDHRHLQCALAVGVEGLQAESGEVDHDEAAPGLARQPAQALQVPVDLLQALLGRDVECGEHRVADDAIDLEPVALLKPLHRRHGVRIVEG